MRHPLRSSLIVSAAVIIVAGALAGAFTAGWWSAQHEADYEPTDPYARYYEFTPYLGTPKEEVVRVLGQPDQYSSGYLWNDRAETLGYGPFSAFDQTRGDVTECRLVLQFRNGVLDNWSKNYPPSERGGSRPNR